MRTSPLGVLLVVCACTGESREATVYSDSAGIQIAVNDHRHPNWSRTDTWMVSHPPRLQLGNIPYDRTHQLYGVMHARRLRDGRIAVANSGVGDVRVYGPDGTLTQTIEMPKAHSGDGIAPMRVEQLGGDSLLVVTTAGALLIFDGSGKLLAESRLAGPSDLPEEPQIVGAFRDGSLLARAVYPDDSAATGVGRRQVRLLRYAPDGQLLASFGDLGGQAILHGEAGAYIFGATAQYAAADSTIWYAGADRYEAREIAPGGRTLRIVRLDRPGSRVTQTDIVAYRQAAKRVARGTPDEATIDAVLENSVFAETFPAFDQLRLDDAGSVWLRSYRWFDMGGGHSWTVFDSAGRYLGEVRTPAKLEIYQIGPDFLLGRLSTNTGQEAVYIWDLAKPGAARAGSPSHS
jgi:hypothetical protein